ncbi:SAM-dependent methyltransferase [Rhodococcus sp. X156]|uniref:SAM-dependent methyltransferase n=1 Tax=Rhodococcus sp. X156 TaxID=2499145 RepID=UPI000FD83823|nr:SAM-dependent methyltransferase [Rhodococcus sp. X156]
MPPTPRWTDWEQAWEQALYGPAGFVHAAGPPEAHFRTSVHVGTVLAEAMLELLRRTDHALQRPARLDVVDLGAGGGQLLAAVWELAEPDLRRRLRPVAVDLRAAPPGWALPWRSTLPATITGLVVAHEWLDALACPVVQRHGAVVHRLAVAPDGQERLGPPVAAPELAWLRRWWPLADGERAEVGLPRERAWGQVRRRLRAGAALAVDYGHVRGTRPAAGTLSAYRAGRQVRPVPDGTCDLTAHVALDAVAALAPGSTTTQAEALGSLAGGTLAGGTPPGQPWLQQAVRAGQLAELTDPDGLGGFGWVLHPTHVDLRL